MQNVGSVVRGVALVLAQVLRVVVAVQNRVVLAQGGDAAGRVAPLSADSTQRTRLPGDTARLASTGRAGRLTLPTLPVSSVAHSSTK